ncbi:MAG: acyclic terpene utilization AtuA family protein, partial [Myxococcales bacterium]
MIEVEPVRIGAGAGFSGDRLEPAVILAERGRIQFLVLECLAERTIALAQLRRRQDPEGGTDPLLDRRMALLLPVIHRNGVRIV